VRRALSDRDDAPNPESVKYCQNNIDRFPPEDFVMNKDRLHIVAFVQNLDTGDILQAVRARVPASGRVTVRQ
jgi:hypothetical protein